MSILAVVALITGACAQGSSASQTYGGKNGKLLIGGHATDPTMTVVGSTGAFRTVRLPVGAEPEGCPVPSPNGVTFARVVGGAIQIRYLNGRLVRSVKSDLVPVEFSPDGRTLVGTIPVTDDSFLPNEIGVLSLATGTTTNLTNTPFEDEREPTVSPIGDTVAYRRTGEGLFTSALDGSGEAQVAGSDGADVLPSWSASGSNLAFVRTGSSGDAILDDLYQVDAGGGTPGLVYDGGSIDRPAYAPAGNRILFSVGDGGAAPEPHSLVMTAPDSGDDVSFLSLDVEYAHLHTWSPNAKRVAFAAAFFPRSLLYTTSPLGNKQRKFPAVHPSRCLSWTRLTDASRPPTKAEAMNPFVRAGRRARFRFTSSERLSVFDCRIDRKGPFRRCRSPLRRRLGRGLHTLAVRAVDKAGNLGTIDRATVRVVPADGRRN